MQDNGANDPLAELFARIFQHPPGATGDYVYSQTELDRVITELMEQHQGNAPPPAPKEVLENLPKVKVDEQRVIDGEDCAVCKDDLIVGEEVVQLPCKHVYHELCVKKWLEAHDVRHSKNILVRSLLISAADLSSLP
jgi:E3 ubiquitin-protein ligase RNF115/126